MKIPYSGKIIDTSFGRYWKDLTGTLPQNSQVQPSRAFFKHTYPLFVLIEALHDSDYLVNPTQQLLLAEAVAEGDKSMVAKIVRTIGIKGVTEEDKLLRQAVLKQQVTPYLSELYSDTLMLLNHFYLNNYRGCYISLRSILEDLYRHLYYKDHFQEFWIVNDVENGYEEFTLKLTPQFFREYLTRTTFLQMLSGYNRRFETATEPGGQKTGENLFDWNEDLYKKASYYVHAGAITYMSGFEKPSDLQFDEDKSKSVISLTKEVMTLTTIFLICAHRAHFLKFNGCTKSLILEIFEQPVKHNFRRVMNV
jgi:hypothetical protein